MGRRLKKISLVKEAKKQPRRVIQTSSGRNHPTRRGTGGWGKVFTQVRAIFVFLLLAAIATFILAHLNEINSLAAAKAHQMEKAIQKNSAHSAIRETALRYEKEVNAAADGRTP